MKNNHRNSGFNPGYLFALCTLAIWSGNFIIARSLNDSIRPISLAFFRWLITILICLPFCLKSVIKEWNTLKKHIPYLSITALLGVTLFNTLVYYAGQSTTAINLSLIAITYPIFIIILSRIFFEEKITIYKAGGICLVLVGVILLLTKGNLSTLLEITFSIGDFWMLLAAFIFAIYTILLKQKPKKIGAWSFQLSTFVLGTLFLAPFFIWESLTTPQFTFEPKVIFSLFYVGIFASFIAYAFWNKAIASLGPSKVGLIYYSLPMFSAIAASLFLNEQITPFHLYSVLLIIPGILIANYKGKKDDRTLT